MANNYGIGLTKASTDPAYNQHLQQVASWAFVIDQGRLAGEQDAMRMSQLFEAASYLGITELTYDSMVAVVNEAKRREALGMVVMSTTNPYRQAADPFTKYQEAYRNIARADMERLLAGLSEKERAMVAEQLANLEADGNAASVVSSAQEQAMPSAEASPVPGAVNEPVVPPSAGAVSAAPASGASTPEAGDDGAEGNALSGPNDIPNVFPGSQGGSASQLLYQNLLSAGQGGPHKHKIVGQKVATYGQRVEGLGKVLRKTSRVIRKKGGEAHFDKAKKVENFARQSQKTSKLLQKAGTALAAAQSIKEFASGDLKKSVATAARTGGSLVVTRLAFWVAGLFGLTIKGLIVTAITWNVILIASKLFKLSIPKWMRWAIIIFDVAIPLLVAVIVIIFFVISCYITKGNFVGQAFLALSSLFSSPASLFREFCTAIGV
jgi:hypothetical protein